MDMKRKLLIAAFVLSSFLLFVFSCAPQSVQQQASVEQPQQAATIDSQQVKMYLSLGWENYKNKQYDRAIEHFRKVLELDPQNEKAYKFMADCCLRHPDTTYIDTALALYENAIKKFPQNAYFYSGLGYVYEKMAASLDRQAESAVDSASAAALEMRRDELEKRAMEYFKKAYSLKSDDENTTSAIAAIFLRQGEYDSAIVWYESTTQIDSNNIDAWKILAKLYDIKKQNEKAVVAYKNLHRLAPDEPEYLLKTGQYLAKTGNLKDATEILQKYIDKNPNDYRGYQYMGLALSADGKYSQALEQLKKAEELNPNSAKLMCDIAATYKEMRKYSSAEKYISKAKKIDRNYGYIYIVEGEIVQQKATDQIPEDNTLTMEVKCQFITAVKIYRKALKDPDWAEFAKSKIDYLKPYLPTKEEIAAYKFINPGVKCGD